MKLLKKKRAILFSFLIFILATTMALVPKAVFAKTTVPQVVGPDVSTPTPDTSNAKVHVYFFYSNECSHCISILDEIVTPLQEQYPGLLDIRLLELGNPDCYSALMTVEDFFEVKSEERGLPTVVLGEQILIGDEPNRAGLKNAIEAGLAGSGIQFPDIPCLDPASMLSTPPNSAASDLEACTVQDPSACELDAPIYAAYFYQVGCKECSRADTDLKYLRSLYPQLVIEEFNIYDNTPLANWLAERAGRGQDLKVPALFIAEKAWIGEGEITPQNLKPEIEKLVPTGSTAIWEEFDQQTGVNSLIDKFKSIGWLAIVLAGLVDGLNPCAFATIVFFVSYLTLSGHKGKEALITGASFTVGVFITYLVVGLGFYKILDLVHTTLALVGKIVYGLTAALCLVLAFFTIKDYFKARQGAIEDMSLNLPERLRKRINATIRQGRKSSSYYLGAFLTGIVISVLELACTGQIYLPTIIFMSSVPELRGRAISYLLLYNLMFIIPLIVVFILAFYGTTSKDLTNFLKKHAAPVKLGMALVFVILAIWLIMTLIA